MPQAQSGYETFSLDEDRTVDQGGQGCIFFFFNAKLGEFKNTHRSPRSYFSATNLEITPINFSELYVRTMCRMYTRTISVIRYIAKIGKEWKNVQKY